MDLLAQVLGVSHTMPCHSHSVGMVTVSSAQNVWAGWLNDFSTGWWMVTVSDGDPVCGGW